MGIWATCARRMEGRATKELKAMFEEVSHLTPYIVLSDIVNSVLGGSMAWCLARTM